MSGKILRAIPLRRNSRFGSGGASIGPNSTWPAILTPPYIELAITPPSEYTTELITSIPGFAQ